MKRNFSKHLTGQIGENLVVAELGRLNIVATSFAGNVPDIDLVAYRDGRTLHLQVKSWRKGLLSFDAKRYLKISIENEIQSINGIDEDIDPDLIFVFVNVGSKSGDDRFFILPQETVQQIIKDNYQSFLDKCNGRRPRNPQTTHCAIALQDLVPYENNWKLIEETLPT